MLPKVGEYIFVPSQKGDGNFTKYFHGGRAKVNRVTTALSKECKEISFICVTEHTGYKEYKWDDLKNIQEKLKQEFSKNGIPISAYVEF